MRAARALSSVPALILASVTSTAGFSGLAARGSLRSLHAPFPRAPMSDDWTCQPVAWMQRSRQRSRRAVSVRSLFAIMSPQEVLEAYTELLVQSPIPTKVVTAAVLGGAGDFVAQLAESASKPNKAEAKVTLDPTRSASMIAFSAIYTGAFQAWWINTLQENVHLADPVLDAAVKTGLCQFGTIPLVYMPLFFLITGAVRGMGLEASIANGKENYVRIYSRNVLFWIPVQMYQFLFVSPEWQIPFLCAGGLTWSVILSTLALQKQEGASSDQQAPDTALSAEPPDQVQAPIALDIKAAAARDQVGREEEGDDKEKSSAGESDLAGAGRSNSRV